MIGLPTKVAFQDILAGAHIHGRLGHLGSINRIDRLAHRRGHLPSSPPGFIIT